VHAPPRELPTRLQPEQRLPLLAVGVAAHASATTARWPSLTQTNSLLTLLPPYLPHTLFLFLCLLPPTATLKKKTKPITRSPPNNHLPCSAAAASTHENRNKNTPKKKKKKALHQIYCCLQL